ncbi:flagellar protein FlaG [Undibacterium sp. RTI2.1]|uniref:flagellar protein FlaG n=1 Tax=unclassified Undibacterium TaxID=2630295 RepID=UPI002AB56833|nr:MULTISPECIES: flagellar protein FlaG [unclassified Undibacterium]MDY7539530.1 flagellar protein FlaG [Undibacterium sp. 5I1]MEB0030166.1 flagellar protein FlaG [Undibacterium sp. RTI2.1]MEB0116694.1 flagellar protein FlaG [Undibacterium sp. RTI2.2]MEB0232293.1 flagellar protein FlaG [Undibacterium sp. 10I3]MEB0258579.1 flagellar protein FlaG [Undibacterium sp. 5I1]
MSISQITGSGNAVSSAPVPVLQTVAPAAKSANATTVAATSSTDNQAASTAPVSNAELKKSVDAINNFINSDNSVNFSIDNDSGKVVIKIVDSQTNTVLRQIPSVEVLAVAKDLAKLQGLLINDKA